MFQPVPRILLIDDDPALLEALCELLTYRLRPAVVVVHASSDDVVPKVAAERYDVLVCDLKMPRQGGLEVIHRIKTANPAQRSILITGCIEESIEQQAHQQGADAVLRKPLDRDEVVSVIRSLMELPHTAPKKEAGDVGGVPVASIKK
jgi:CheY-like chemotaxis protein